MFSQVKEVGHLIFPAFSGTRIMMMPFYMEDLTSLPESLFHYVKPVRKLVSFSPVKKGVAYLTIDEALVLTGETHRRPGLHCDGIGPDKKAAGWGGGGGWGASGMFVSSNVSACEGWHQIFKGEPEANGDCAHLAPELQVKKRTLMKENSIYYCNPLAVHRSIPVLKDVHRSFIRLSLPNNCPWYDGYTENPAVRPTGPIHKPRKEQMSFRP